MCVEGCVVFVPMFLNTGWRAQAGAVSSYTLSPEGARSLRRQPRGGGACGGAAGGGGAPGQRDGGHVLQLLAPPRAGAVLLLQHGGRRGATGQFLVSHRNVCAQTRVRQLARMARRPRPVCCLCLGVRRSMQLFLSAVHEVVPKCLHGRARSSPLWYSCRLSVMHETVQHKGTCACRASPR